MKYIKRVRKTVTCVSETGLTDEFYGSINPRTRSIFVIDSYLKDSAFTAVKRDAKFYTRYVKGVTFVNRRYTRGVPFCQTGVFKGKELDLRAETPRINIG